MTRYLDDPNEVEFLAFGYGTPPTSVLAELRFLWLRLHAHGVRLPAERRVVLIEAVVP